MRVKPFTMTKAWRPIGHDEQIGRGAGVAMEDGVTRGRVKGTARAALKTDGPQDEVD